jgi:hypothetical protein
LDVQKSAGIVEEFDKVAPSARCTFKKQPVVLLRTSRAQTASIYKSAGITKENAMSTLNAMFLINRRVNHASKCRPIEKCWYY